MLSSPFSPIQFICFSHFIIILTGDSQFININSIVIITIDANSSLSLITYMLSVMIIIIHYNDKFISSILYEKLCVCNASSHLFNWTSLSTSIYNDDDDDLNLCSLPFIRFNNIHLEGVLIVNTHTHIPFIYSNCLTKHSKHNYLTGQTIEKLKRK